MADESRPRVAAIGGFYDLDKNVQLGQEARKDAEEIGRAIAEAGCGLVVYFSDDKSLGNHTLCAGSWLRFLLVSLGPASTCATPKHSAGR